MMGSSFAHRLALIAAACLTLVEGADLHAQDKGLPDSVRAGLVRYAGLEPLAVTWSGSIEVTPIGREKIAADVVNIIIANGSKNQQLAFREGRIYVRREMKGGPSTPLMTNEIAFDRNTIYMGKPVIKGQQKSKAPAVLVKRPPKKDRPESSYFSDDYFRATGVRVAIRNEELVQDWRPQSELLALLAEGGRVEAVSPTELDGRHLIRVQVRAKDLRIRSIPRDLPAIEKQLRLQRGITEEEVQRRLRVARKLQERQPPQRRYDFYFDPERAYAVRRLETRDETGHLLTRSDCTEHEQLPGRVVWLPRQCQVEEYTFNELRDEETLIPYVFASPLYVIRLRGDAFDVKPWPYERFELKYTEPGTSIQDATFPEVKGRHGVSYKVPANPQQLDKAVEIAREQYQAREKSQEWGKARKQSGTRKMLLALLSGAILIGIVIYYVVRWRKARRA